MQMKLLHHTSRVSNVFLSEKEDLVVIALNK